MSALEVIDVAHLAAVDAVRQVARPQQGGGRDDDRAELDGGEHDLPERRDVAEHEEHAVTAVDADLLQPRGHL